MHDFSGKWSIKIFTFNFNQTSSSQITRVFAGLVRSGLCIFTTRSATGTTHPKEFTQEVQEECQTVLYDDKCRSEADDWLKPTFLRLDSSSNSVKCMTFVGGDQLWCGCGNNIVVVDTVNMAVVKHLPVFVKKMTFVNELVFDGNAVWGVGSHLSCALQWDIKTYALVGVLDCSSTDPTGLMATSDLREFEDIFDLGQTKQSMDEADPVVLQQPEQQPSSVHLDVSNEPRSQTSQTGLVHVSRRNLTTVYRTRGRAQTQAASAMRDRVQTVDPTVKGKTRTHQMATRAKSLLVMDDALWVGRGMGDVIIFDISPGPTHGKVLARLASSDCMKYGNKSQNKLVAVAGQYVVSSQWLEKVDQTSEDKHSHQAITVWEAWSRKRIEEFRVLSNMLVPQSGADNHMPMLDING